MEGWEQVAAEPLILTAEYPVHGWHGRTTVLGRSGEDLVVYNPGASLSAQQRAAIRRTGRVTLLVLPNHFHHLGVSAWLDAFPGALVVASTLAIPRLRAQAVEATGFDGLDLPDGAHFLEPVGLKSGELWLSTPTPRGRCWIVGDAFFNVARLPRHPAGALLWLTGTAPGLRIGSTVIWLAVGDPVAYRDWLQTTLAAERPEILIPAHGDVVRDPQLGRRLERLAAARL